MKTEENDLLSGFTGKIGNTGLYRRMVNGRAVIQRCPNREKIQKYEDWPDQVKRFYHASKYASAILQDQEVKALYEKVAYGFNSATSMAVKDYLIPAAIGKVVTAGYMGRVSYCIVIRIDNIIPVRSVKVTIENPHGETIESGQARMQPSGTNWHYITTKPNPQYKGSLLRIVSRDLPDHTVEWTRRF